MTAREDEEFLWGVATSAYQVEGGYNGPGQPATNWAAAEAREDVAVTGATSDFWTRYEEDFARCRAMGLTAFRMGIEWSRVQPVVGAWTERRRSRARVALWRAPALQFQAPDLRASPPPFDRAALNHYVEMFAACRRHGMEPVVTLHHFVHPAWLGPDPWLDPRTPALFAAYVREAVSYICERLDAPLRWFITINEPNMLVLNSYFARYFPAAAKGGVRTMVAAYNQLLRAHIAAYNTLHDLYAERGWPAAKVSLNNYCSDIYWADKLILDLLCTRERGVPQREASQAICKSAHAFDAARRAAKLPLRRDLAFFIGTLIRRALNRAGYRHFDAADFAPALDDLYASPRARVLDFVGLDYYDPFVAHVFRLPTLWDHEFKNKSMREWVLATVTSKWWDWRVLPRGLHFFCEYYARDLGRPVLIAENGMALRRRVDNSATHRRDQMSRSDFLRMHVREVARIVEDGIPVVGYLHWSLVDNYEWGSFTPRFGLFSLDYTRGTERQAQDHFGDRPSDTYAALIREARGQAAAGADR